MLRVQEQYIDPDDQTTIHDPVCTLEAPEPSGEDAGTLLNFEGRTPAAVRHAASRPEEPGSGRAALVLHNQRDALPDQTCDPDRAIDLLGLTSVSSATFDQTLRRIVERPSRLPFAYVVTPNAHHMVILSRADSALRAAYDAAWLRLCDSQILRAISWLVTGARLNLVTGSDLTLSLLRNVVQPSDRVTIIGGTPELITALRDQFGLQDIAQHIPPMGYSADHNHVQRCVDFVLAHPARFYLRGYRRSAIGVVGASHCADGQGHRDRDFASGARSILRRAELCARRASCGIAALSGCSAYWPIPSVWFTAM